MPSILNRPHFAVPQSDTLIKTKGEKTKAPSSLLERAHDAREPSAEAVPCQHNVPVFDGSDVLQQRPVVVRLVEDRATAATRITKTIDGTI